jgi:hypothetical protein
MRKGIIRLKLDSTISGGQSCVEAAEHTQSQAANDMSNAIRLKSGRAISSRYGVTNGVPKTVIRRKFYRTISGGQGFVEMSICF